MSCKNLKHFHNFETIVEKSSYSTHGKLIAPGIVVPGTISITSTDVYFDADEDDPLYKQQDPKVCGFFNFLIIDLFSYFILFLFDFLPNLIHFTIYGVNIFESVARQRKKRKRNTYHANSM